MHVLRVVQQHSLSSQDRAVLFERRRSLDQIMPVARSIMETVREEGDAALLRYTRDLDGADLQRIEVSEDEFEAAQASVGPAVYQALQVAIAHVRAFHRVQIPADEPVETAPGVCAWREWRPIERVGLYVPGGRGPYPSSVVMLGVPAALAGCPEIVLCTPPAKDGTIPPATLAAARLAGIHRVFKVGGAQAIAAMTYGTESVPRVDKVFGAGNAYVTAAKLLAFPDVALDVPAGPSELLIIADDSAEPGWVAADLLSNAEHGPDSSAALITVSSELARRVADEVERQCNSLPRKEIARTAIQSSSLAVVVDSLRDAVDLANDYAPEHLEIMTRNPREVLARIRHAGSVFLGPYSPNAAGDYATGTNHVLPTSLYARTAGPVSVESFGRLMQCQELSRDGLQALSETVRVLAREESLEGHARAVENRFSGDP